MNGLDDERPHPPLPELWGRGGWGASSEDLSITLRNDYNQRRWYGKVSRSLAGTAGLGLSVVGDPAHLPGETEQDVHFRWCRLGPANQVAQGVH
jgi:hypothetical protein